MTPDTLAHATTAYEEQLAIFRAGHEWWRDGERWSAVMDMTYCDVSAGDGALSAGSYLGHETPWLDAIAAWDRALKDAGVQEFHATDFYSALGEFDDDKWRHEVPGKGMVVGGDRHNEFAERFTTIPVNHGLIGFAYSLDVGAFNEILAPVYANEKRKHHQDATTKAIMGSLSLQHDWFVGQKYFAKNSIQVIFELEKGAGRFIDFFNESKARTERWAYWFKSFTTAPKSFLPLQMADLLAHETWRRIKEVWSPKPRPIRKSFAQMLADGRIQHNQLDRNHCITNAEQLRDLLTRYPDGLVPQEETRDVDV